MFKKSIVSVAVCGLLLASAGVALAEVAVVDSVRIFNESKPGKAGEAHLVKVRDVLQKGLADMEKAWKGKEKSTEGQQALREGYMALERQLATERQNILQLMGGALEKSVKEWRAKNSKYSVVVSRQTVIDSDAKADVTDQVMKVMDTQKVTFPELPKVTVNGPKAGAPQKKK